MAAKGQCLAARRKVVGLTQEQLAERLGVERSTVVRWEGGETVPLPWVRPKLGRALHVSIEQLNELLALEPAHQPGTVVSAVDEHGIHIEQSRQEQTRTTVPIDDMTTVAVGQAMVTLLAQAYARLATAGALPFPDGLRAATTLSPLDDEDLRGAREPTGSSAVPAGQVRGQLAQFLCGWMETMDRRELIQLLGWAADTDEQQRLARAIASPSLVDARVIDHIAAMLRPRLFSIYSDMSTATGYYFFELNDINSSRRYYDQARAAAHNSGSVELGIYALCEWSSTESWQGPAPTGLDLAVAAQNPVSKAEDPLMQVGAAQRAATACAFDDQCNERMVECERAQNSLVTAAGSASDESPGYFYNDGDLASHRSECLLRLGKPQEAAVSACTGLMLYDKSFKELDDRLEDYGLRRSGAW